MTGPVRPSTLTLKVPGPGGAGAKTGSYLKTSQHIDRAPSTFALFAYLTVAVKGSIREGSAVAMGQTFDGADSTALEWLHVCGQRKQGRRCGATYRFGSVPMECTLI